jgi:hypothetical protein
MRKFRDWKHRHWGEHVIAGVMVASAVLEWIPMPSPVRSAVNW